MAANVKYLDTLEYVKQSKALGASEELSEYQVKKIEEDIENAVIDIRTEVKTKDIASKSDIKETELRIQKEIEVVRKQIKEAELNLQKEIEMVRKEIREVDLSLKKEIEIIRKEIIGIKYDTLKFIIWTGVGVVVALGGMIGKGFHWF
ncbi:MAG: hypothetical protein ACK5Z5_03535 [Neisseriaceae bacterium]